MNLDSWQCPFCKNFATIRDYQDRVSKVVGIKDPARKNVSGIVGAEVTLTMCPNKECHQLAIKVAYGHPEETHSELYMTQRRILAEWLVRPAASAKEAPSYVPAAIAQDFTESWAIIGLSPKASATLSRRCLQGMIRDYWGVVENRLVDEIKKIKDRVDPETWDAIEAVRNIGNIGAHMEKDIGVIIDVEAGEAEALHGLIELLIEEWYVHRYERQKRLTEINGIAAKKAAAKIPASSPGEVLPSAKP